MAASTTAQDKRQSEPVFYCNDVRLYLLNGRDMYLELRRNIFTAQCIYAGVLCSWCSAFIYGFSIITQNSIWSPQIVIDLPSLVSELESLYNILNEISRVEAFETENSRYMCEDNQEARRGRPRFSVPGRQSIGLRKIKFI
jgi:hypothetical protein